MKVVLLVFVVAVIEGGRLAHKAYPPADNLAFAVALFIKQSKIVSCQMLEE